MHLSMRRVRGVVMVRSFKRSATEKILKEVLEEKMAFTNERDKKGRLSFVYNSDDSGETIREIVEDCQKKVIGAPVATASRLDQTYRAARQIVGPTRARATRRGR